MRIRLFVVRTEQPVMLKAALKGPALGEIVRSRRFFITNPPFDETARGYKKRKQFA